MCTTSGTFLLFGTSDLLSAQKSRAFGLHVRKAQNRSGSCPLAPRSAPPAASRSASLVVALWATTTYTLQPTRAPTVETTATKAAALCYSLCYRHRSNEPASKPRQPLSGRGVLGVSYLRQVSVVKVLGTKTSQQCLSAIRPRLCGGGVLDHKTRISVS